MRRIARPKRMRMSTGIACHHRSVQPMRTHPMSHIDVGLPTSGLQPPWGRPMNASTETRLKPQVLHWLREPVVQHCGTYDQVADAIAVVDLRAFALNTTQIGRAS